MCLRLFRRHNPSLALRRDQRLPARLCELRRAILPSLALLKRMFSFAPPRFNLRERMRAPRYSRPYVFIFILLISVPVAGWAGGMRLVLEAVSVSSALAQGRWHGGGDGGGSGGGGRGDGGDGGRERAGGHGPRYPDRPAAGGAGRGGPV